MLAPLQLLYKCTIILLDFVVLTIMCNRFERNALSFCNTDITNDMIEFVQMQQTMWTITVELLMVTIYLGIIAAITPENLCAKPIPRMKITKM